MEARPVKTGARVGDAWMIEQGLAAGRSRDGGRAADGAARAGGPSGPVSGQGGARRAEEGGLVHGTILYRPSRIRDGDRHRDRHPGCGGDSQACRFRPTRRWCRRRCRSPRPTWAATRRIWKRPSRSRSRSNWSGWTACCTTSPPAPTTASSLINVTFKLGTNPDIAAVQTQNRVNVALPRLPPEVQRQGVIGEEGLHRVPDGGRPGLERRPLRLAVPDQLRADQPGEPDRQPAGSGRIAPEFAAGLLDARLAESGQDDEARASPRPTSPTPSRRRTGRIRRARSDRRPRRAAPIFNMR